MRPRDILILTLTALAVILPVAPAAAQKSTEIYIPIGKSPGLSFKHTLIGHITSVNEQERTFEIRGRYRTYTAKMDDDTRIWLDRHWIRKRNVKGAHEDCRRGRLVEVKYEGRQQAQSVTCDWIKIAVTANDRRVPVPRRPTADY